MTNPADRVRGCILGGALGDALGLPYEGRGCSVEAVELKGSRISDDTQLTLATCEAIIESEGTVDASVIASRFASWHLDRRISGVGASTQKALTELVGGGHWALVGRKGEYAAGNGAAMRSAPLAFVLDPRESDARQLIRDVSRITHHNEEAFVGALAVTVAVRAAWDGTWRGESDLLPHIIESIPDSGVRDRLAELTQLETELPLVDVAHRFGSTGYVIESVPLALYAVQRIQFVGFESLMRELIGIGGDADTIASIAGQVSGTFIGEKNLPQHLLGQLHEIDFITSVTNQFAERVLSNSVS